MKIPRMSLTLLDQGQGHCLTLKFFPIYHVIKYVCSSDISVQLL